jgi:hypothetical protein
MISSAKAVDRYILAGLIAFEMTACYNFYFREIAWYPPSNYDQTIYQMEAYRTKERILTNGRRSFHAHDWSGVHAGQNAALSLRREGYYRSSFSLGDFVDTMTYPGFWRLVRKHARSGLEEMYGSFSKRAFTRSLQKLIPEICDEDIVPAESGVRAQALRSDGGLLDDFLIVNNCCGMHVCQAPSPAATASFEIGE